MLDLSDQHDGRGYALSKQTKVEPYRSQERGPVCAFLSRRTRGVQLDPANFRLVLSDMRR